jgi:6-phosphogluconolactonase
MDIRTYSTPEAVARAGAELFVTLAAKAIAARGRFCVALSGGSTPRAMYSLLSSGEFNAQVDWERVHIFWSDERCVPPDHADSNYRMAHESWLDHVPIPPDHVHRIHGEDNPEQAAADYEYELRSLFGHGVPRFDLVLLGLGDDGHTASIFPGAPAIHEQARWVMPVDHTTPPPPLVSRVTLAPVVLNASAMVVFMVTGVSKAARLAQVLNGLCQPDLQPAQIVQPYNGKLLWLVDRAAAAELKV